MYCNMDGSEGENLQKTGLHTFLDLQPKVVRESGGDERLVGLTDRKETNPATRGALRTQALGSLSLPVKEGHGGKDPAKTRETLGILAGPRTGLVDGRRVKIEKEKKGSRLRGKQLGIGIGRGLNPSRQRDRGLVSAETGQQPRFGREVARSKKYSERDQDGPKDRKLDNASVRV